MEFTGGQKVCQRGVFWEKPVFETPPENSDSWPAKWLQIHRKPVTTVPLNPSQIGQSLQTSRRARFWRVLPGFRELSKVSEVLYWGLLKKRVEIVLQIITRSVSEGRY